MGALGGGLLAMFKVTSSLMVGGRDTSWSEAFLLMTKVGAQSLFSGRSKSGVLGSGNRPTKLMLCRRHVGGVFGHGSLMNRDRRSCIPEIASSHLLAPSSQHMTVVLGHLCLVN